MMRIRSCAAALFLLAAVLAAAEDSGSGLGHIYIEPFNGSFEKLLKFEIVRQHIPVLVIDSAKSADCVLGWTAMPGVEGRTDFVLVDRQTRTVTWEFRTRGANLNSPKRNVPQKTSAQIVHSLSKAGAYCGGAAFSAPAESADQRVKAFKPPTFNW
jgi:hypothetical protein